MRLGELPKGRISPIVRAPAAPRSRISTLLVVSRVGESYRRIDRWCDHQSGPLKRVFTLFFLLFVLFFAGFGCHKRVYLHMLTAEQIGQIIQASKTAKSFSALARATGLSRRAVTAAVKRGFTVASHNRPTPRRIRIRRNELRKLTQLTCSKGHRKWPRYASSKKVVFSDESWLCCNERTGRLQWCKKRDDALPLEKKARWNVPSIMVWATAGYDWKGPLIIFPSKHSKDGELRRRS